ncbi:MULTISPECIES: type II toxin-antitoxin system RelE/ParE family toxin [unclassified Microcoleus]|uniref:type II toxin-antitoxin system RelE/ParE family toxin n=1 Tax=unclassified Microcoleus TaxID=2642155 RepID=UPI002FCF0D6F
MTRYILAPSAKRELKEIVRYIAQFNPDSAKRLKEAIKQQCKLLVDFPSIGRSRDELELGLRSFLVEDYLIFYRAVSGNIEIVRIVSGYRDIELLFSGESSGEEEEGI